MTSGCGQTPPTVAVGGFPSLLAVDRVTHTIYVANTDDSTVSVIDGNTCNGTDASGCGQTPPTVAVGSGPEGVAVNQATETIYVGNGRDVLTIEGLATKEQLHPLQQLFEEKGSLQCGFCGPGVIMSAKALLDENPDPSELEIRDALAGNLCRCTGYTKMIEAIQAVAQLRQDQPTAKSVA